MMRTTIQPPQRLGAQKPPPHPTPPATTAVAQKLVAGTGLIGHMIDDRTWTVTDGVEATEIAYVSYEGYTTKMFVVEVDLSNPAISIAASLPDNGTTFKMQSMTRQALAADAAGNKVGSRKASNMRFRLNIAAINFGMTIHLWDKKKQ